ncbi:hypothetical protein B9G53_12245 [Pseudanabaena sp. SR411]|uniref:response regulator n=1 Tax=Pseudanabaena sp. SR411 TaxID=1980935 RepID=UPI000B999711|nr:response regulator [Pseudanabaena sp. SR411]OYQ64305.1 hypothetical protein B9G53_12245 [Pseudanabaena sp. SR411]
MKILLVEDDIHSAEILSQLLAESHYTIDSALNAKTAWQHIETYTYDLVILDIMLPDSDGIGLCTKLRNSGYTIPVLLLTAKDSTNDRVMGLEAGADDYVVKPYNFQELVARIRALLRRYRDRDTLIQELTWEQIRLDLKSNKVTYKHQPLHLTQKEYGLLELFLRYPQQVFSRSALLDQVWSAGEFPSEEVVTTHIKGLRRKLKATGLPIDPIETLYGLGYRLKPEPVQAEERQTVKSLVTNTLPEESLSQIDKSRVLEVIAIMTKKLIAILPESIALFHRVAIALNQGNLDPDLRYDGYMEAHRLIGSMGSLGFPEGSAIAFQIEQMLKNDFALMQTDTTILQQLISNLEASTCDQLKPVSPILLRSQQQSDHPQQQQSDRPKSMPPSSPIPTSQINRNSDLSQSSAAMLTVLIVDDDQVDRATYISYLQTDRSHLYHFLEADTRESGLELWRSQNPDIVIIDCELPNGEGLELLQTIVEENLEVGTIALTGSENEQILQVMGLGASDYLVKGAITSVSIINRVGQVGDFITLDRQLKRSQQQEILIAKITLHIRQYLSIEDIANSIVQEVRAFLNADRSIVYQFNPDMSGTVVAESVLSPWKSCLDQRIDEYCFQDDLGGAYREGRVFSTFDVYTANLHECHLKLMEQFQVRANLVLPILITDNKTPTLWGLLIAHQCEAPRIWEESDIRLLQQLSVQLAIALQQAELYQNLQKSNTDLENRVTERTAELFQRQQEFIALAENSPSVIMRLDLQLRHLYVNLAIERATGIPVKEFLGKTLREMGFPEKNVTMLESAAHRLLETGQDQRYEIEYPFPEDQGMGYYRAHLIPEYAPDGKIATILSIFYDITQNKLNEIALQESNRRWQYLLDNVNLMVVGLNCAGKVEYINPFLLNITGYAMEEVIGKDWFSQFISQIDQLEIREAFSSLLNNDFPKYCQNAIVTKAGEERMISWNNTILRNQDNEIIGTLSIGEDITEKLKVDRIKNEFISIVSHELRTPLASIRGALGLLSSGVLANRPETAQNMLNIASSDTERLVRLVNDILDLERLESSKVTLDRNWCDVLELCQQAIETMQAIATENQIEILCNVQSQQIVVDRDRLVQTLVNLLSNAIKFSTPQSQVHLEASQIADEIVFRVCDRGRGIPANHLESIFERFHQVDASDSRQMGGTGLGLAICRSIVQQHGGKIWVESVLSEGSTFSFTIPHRI